MANPELLNNVTHKDLRVIREHNAQLNEHTMMALVFPFEFKSLQHEYPIVFRKDPQTSEFSAVALLGLEDNENLYLQNDSWDASYIPLMIERQPFMIGMKSLEVDGEIRPEPVILIDLDSPKVSKTQGEPLFLPHGGTSDYLEHISSLLSTLRERETETRIFIDALVKHDLLESFFLDIEMPNQQTQRLAGFYTINEDNLAQLTANAVSDLHQKGILQPIYMTVASMVNFADLITRKIKRESGT
ncbi:SapC family protein [Alteromonas pelagimontana]|uniref:SapC family protein n=1 Tax=Alteromonas pelagimontana TaxID=1858656 RepID=A0A6M4MGM9_9ALTE|nr:SapC family protein [Alteromonas pelagimontana]QJR81366.1 SapC family protein [Alteromonas pelagimontana]